MEESTVVATGGRDWPHGHKQVHLLICRSRPAYLAGAVAGPNGLVAGAEGLQVPRQNSLGRTAIRSVKWLAMDRGNIRNCVLRTLGRRLLRRSFGAANEGARHQ
jgi:hypothetical protein